VHNSNYKIFSIRLFSNRRIRFERLYGNTPGGSPITGSVDNETARPLTAKALSNCRSRARHQTAGARTGRQLSPLELAQARLQVLEGLIQQEVMFQKAEKDGTVPTDEQVTAELNKRKTASGMSQEEFDRENERSRRNRSLFTRND
jgi:hypothetical protein